MDHHGGSRDTVDASGVKPRTRRSREDLRSLLLQAGRDILHEEGIDTGSSNLTFKRVFDRVEQDTGQQLTNASVIRRVWENQADFQADVLVAMVQDEGRTEVELTLEALLSVLEEADLSTAESRLWTLQELCRLGGAANSQAISSSPTWSLWISVVAIATTTSHPDQRSRVRAALLEGYESVTAFWEETYVGLIAFLGLRLRHPWTMRQFTIAVTACGQGYSLRQHVSGDLERFTQPTGRNGEDQEWTLFSAGLQALVLQFFEPDPEFVPPSPQAPDPTRASGLGDSAAG